MFESYLGEEPSSPVWLSYTGDITSTQPSGPAAGFSSMQAAQAAQQYRKALTPTAYRQRLITPITSDESVKSWITFGNTFGVTKGQPIPPAPSIIGYDLETVRVPRVVGYKSSFPTNQGARYSSIDEAKRDVDRMWVAFSQPKPLPTPEQQGGNFAQMIKRLTASGGIGPITTGQEVFQPGGKFYRPVPGYDPSASAGASPTSKLPVIILGVSVVAAIGFLWWKFR